MSLTLEATFIQHFAGLEDPRVERTKHHLLIDIMAIAILAVISGADGTKLRLFLNCSLCLILTAASSPSMLSAARKV